MKVLCLLAIATSVSAQGLVAINADVHHAGGGGGTNIAAPIQGQLNKRATSSTTNVVSFTTSQPIVGNSVVVLFVGSQGSPFTFGGSPCTDNQGNTYTADVTKIHSGVTTLGGLICHAPITTSSGTFSVTVTTSAVTYSTAYIWEVAGTISADGSGCSDQDGTYQCGSGFSTSNAVSLVVGVEGTTYAGGNLGVSASSGYTLPTICPAATACKNDNGGASGTAGGAEYQLTSASGTPNPSWTLANASPNGVQLGFAYKR